MTTRPRLPAWAPGLAIFLLAAVAAARPGGGQTYSGGGSHSGGGGGGGGGLIFFLLRLVLDLVITAPAIGIPLVLAIVIGFAVIALRQQSNQDWNGPSQAAVTASQSPSRVRVLTLDAIRTKDPDFSSVLFEDFAYALFAAAHRARHDAKKLAELAPYLDESMRRALAERGPVGVPVTAAVVGALRVAAVSLGAEYTEVTLEFEANLIFAAPKATTEYVVERWAFHRGANVKSRNTNDARKFACPNCGAPFESTDSQRCKYCGEVVSNGRFDWSVSSATVLESSERPPSLRGTVPERGTDLQTIVDPDFGAAWDALHADDPAVTEDALGARAELIYRELNRSWNAQDLATARGFVSDGLFDYLGYWTTAYRAEGLRNVVDDAKILGFEPVKLRRDLHYDAFTARVFATGKDYTVDASGTVVGGSRHRDREYSEYWTLIRGAGARGAPSADRSCPNCGAELHVEMSGECKYCHVRITTGRFDWVLSKIEQDDSYAG